MVERSDYLIYTTGYGEADIPEEQSDVDLPDGITYEEALGQGLLDSGEDYEDYEDDWEDYDW